MDLYELINFIGNQAFYSEAAFRRRYVHEPENYAELSQRGLPLLFPRPAGIS
jgi:hypothetical protein